MTRVVQLDIIQIHPLRPIATVLFWPQAGDLGGSGRLGAGGLGSLGEHGQEGEEAGPVGGLEGSLVRHCHTIHVYV